MTTKIFGDKKIVIREFQKKDFKKIKEFLEYNHSFNENDMLAQVGKLTKRQELDFLNKVSKNTNKKACVYIFAQHNEKIIGSADIDLMGGRENHVGNFGIKIKSGYRGIGLGTFLMSEVIKLAIRKLKPSPRCIRLECYSNNIPAINLYKKMGFKIYGRIPKQREYKGKLYDEVIMLRFIKKK